MVCDPSVTGQDECLREIVGRFAKRAWRRPLAGDELDRLVALANVALGEGERFVKGVELALHAVLLSPNFLYRSEVGNAQSGGTFKLTAYETASADASRAVTRTLRPARRLPSHMSDGTLSRKAAASVGMAT